jgi:taurine dioxygenase
MTLTIARLSGAFGAEVRGVDLAEGIGDNLFREIKQTWLDHDGVMVVRDQHRLTPTQHVELASRFGELIDPDTPDHRLAGYPLIYRVSYRVDENPKPREFVDTGNAWHADYADAEAWSGVSILHVIEMPPKGGDIFFADLYAAYDTLSPAMQQMLAPLAAVHASGAFVKHRRDLPGSIHPLVRTHPETGRKLLFVSPGFTTAIEGLSARESHVLLGFLKEHVTQPAFILRHRWIPGDLVFWDNRCNLHNAMGDYAGGGRVTFHRVSVRG